MVNDTGAPENKMCYSYADSGPDGLRTLVYPANKTGGKCPDESDSTQKMGWGFSDPIVGNGGYFYTGSGEDICYTHNNTGDNTMRTFVVPRTTNNTCDYSSAGWGYTDNNVGSGGSFKAA